METRTERYRPTLEEKVHYFRQMQERPETGDLQANLEELRELAGGHGEESTKNEWWFGWSQQDFQALLDRLHEEGIE